MSKLSATTNADSCVYALLRTDPFGRPVVPEVKITTPAELSSRYRSDETTMSLACSGGAFANAVVTFKYGIETPFSVNCRTTELVRASAAEEHIIAACCALVTKYTTSSAGFATAAKSQRKHAQRWTA